jgi:very-short-patch-repair endonuclease
VVGETILMRTKNQETGETFTWKNAIEQILSTPVDPDSHREYERLSGDVKRLLEQRKRLLDAAEAWTSAERDLGQATQTWDDETQPLSDDIVSEIKAGRRLPHPDTVRELRSRIMCFPATQAIAWVSWIKKFWWRLRNLKAVRRRLEELAEAAHTFGMQLPEPRADRAFCDALTVLLDKLTHCADLHDLYLRIERLQAQAKGLKPMGDVLADLEGLIERIAAKTPDLLRASMRQRITQLLPEDRQRLVQMRSVLANMQGAVVGDGARIQWQRFFEDQFTHLARAFPLWAVPNLSVRHGLPFAPAILDTLIIDEASQCDIASVIPLLYRARNVVVIGDPNQLQAVHRLQKPRNQQLLRKHGLMAPEYMQYDFIHNSFFDLASTSPACGARIQLRDHFRCHADIAAYFNDVFYNKTLRVLTSESRMRVPKGRKAGIHWTDIVGTAEAVPPSGAISREEIEAVGNELRRMLEEDGFDGSVGVVTPFKIQAQRIRDWAEANLSAALRAKCEFVAATADGFQGDEKDVILCSPVLQPGVPRGSMWFISENRNLWNVAVSRAKALLHVVGNRQMCLDSGIRHLVTLAQRSMKASTFEPGQVVFESPWERKFYEALVSAGIKPVTQYPLAGRRLDLAVLDARLDIEVDGERYHRDEAGRRKAEDLWRDIAVRAAGWTPLRFWVYELREDMDECVRRVQRHLANNHQQDQA